MFEMIQTSTLGVNYIAGHTWISRTTLFVHTTLSLQTGKSQLVPNLVQLVPIQSNCTSCTNKKSMVISVVTSQFDGRSDDSGITFSSAILLLILIPK